MTSKKLLKTKTPKTIDKNLGRQIELKALQLHDGLPQENVQFIIVKETPRNYFVIFDSPQTVFRVKKSDAVMISII